jgi:hypothetical protein
VKSTVVIAVWLAEPALARVIENQQRAGATNTTTLRSVRKSHIRHAGARIQVAAGERAWPEAIVIATRTDCWLLTWSGDIVNTLYTNGAEQNFSTMLSLFFLHSFFFLQSRTCSQVAHLLFSFD